MTSEINDITIEYNSSPVAKFSLMENMIVEKGSIEDWNELHSLHYKAETLPAGARYWKCVDELGSLIGIVVMSSVSLLLAPRHEVFPRLKPGRDTHFTNVHRGVWLNKNLRRAARIVTDPMYRGVGISYRMVNLSMRLEGFRFIEIQSSMSKFNPFDLKAGFTHARLRHAAAYDKGFTFFRKYFDSHPADHMAIMQEFNSMPESIRKGVESAVKSFYYKNSSKERTGSNLNVGTSKVDAMSMSHVIKELQQLVFASPVYGIWENPDVGVIFPESLPLLSFDLQKPTEKMRLDLI